MEIQYNNAKINFSDTGKGNALVLLHGFTETSKIWDDFSEELSKHFRLVCIDLPGHGKSENVDEVHSMELMAEIVKTVLDHLSINKCVLIGHSMGGYVTLAFARMYEENLAGIGLFHSNAYADSEKAKDGRLRAIEAIRKNHHEFLTGFIPDLFAPANRESYKKEINVLVDEAKQMSKEDIIAAQLGMKDRQDSTDVLANAKYPVMFISGHQDSRIPINNIQAQLSLPETAYSLLLKNTGHMGFIEEKEKTLHFLKSFTQGCGLENN